MLILIASSVRDIFDYTMFFVLTGLFCILAQVIVMTMFKFKGEPEKEESPLESSKVSLISSDEQKRQEEAIINHPQDQSMHEPEHEQFHSSSAHSQKA